MQRAKKYKYLNYKKLIYTIIFVLFIFFSLKINANEKLHFSHKRGLYSDTFNLTISSEKLDVKIFYTLDGTNPFISKTASKHNSTLTIKIDPTKIQNRDAAPGFIIRACAILNDSLVSKIYTHTYLFQNKIIELSKDNFLPGANWLTFVNEREHDISYGLDPEIYNDPIYSSQMNDSFTSLPVLSLVTSLDSLFDTYRGIYSNAFFHGNEWERNASLELLNQDGSSGFQINCGLRIRGGWSRHNDNPKHSFRFLFRKEYGSGKLKYPLFGNEGVMEFDNIDLRTTQNFSWAYKGDSNNTFLRDIFSRDIQRDMNQPYTRSRYYHLYINGTYWGLYQTQERPEASYAASYFGGKKADYDVIKVNAGEDFDKYEIEATDGTLLKWKKLWDASQIGFSNDELYYKIQGANLDGSKNSTNEKLLDVNNLIDYMIITFLTGDFDGPITNYWDNLLPNNFYAIYNRNTPDGFKFFRHDAENSLFDIDWGYDRTGPYPAGNKFKFFNPQWLHQKLSENNIYKQVFADRVYKHFFNNGALTFRNNIKRINNRKLEIESAIIAESARWGDSKREEPFTKKDWTKAVNFILNDFLPTRNDIVLQQLIDKNLFYNLQPPQFNSKDTTIDKGFEVKISSSSSNIYYTTDNSDPANSHFTDISSNAKLYNAPISIQEATIIKTRSFDNNKWSPLNESRFIINNNFSNLKITELHYHPLDEISGQDTVKGKEYEFIELKNIGLSEIDLSLTSFSKGVKFVYPKGTKILPDSFLVLASNSLEFYKRYGFYANGEFNGHLSNSGELIEFLNASSKKVFSFMYDDKSPWIEDADGSGYSLVASEINPTGNPADVSYWKKSKSIGGSPLKNDLVSTGLKENNILINWFDLEQNYPNPFNPITTIKYSVPNVETTNELSLQLKVFDVLGREIKTLVNKKHTPGIYVVTFDGSNFASGVFYYQLKIGNNIKTKKMILLK